MLRHEWVICVLLALGFVCTLVATAEQRSGGRGEVDEGSLLSGLERQGETYLLSRTIPADWFWALAYEKQIDEQGGPIATMLQQLRAGKVPTPKKAEGAVWKTRFENRVFPGNISQKTVGLVRCGVDLPGFAARGTLVWIVRLQEADLVLQEVWVNSETAEMRWLLPMTATLERTVRDENGEASSSETLFTGPRSFAGHELLEDPSSVRSRGIYGDYLFIFSETYRSGDGARYALEPGSLPYVEEPLKRRKIGTPEEAEQWANRLRGQAASGSGSQAAGVSVSGDPYVVGLFLSLGNSTGFASSLDPVWVVHFISGGDLLGEVTQAGWINAMTGEARWIFPLDMPTSAAPAADAKQ